MRDEPRPDIEAIPDALIERLRLAQSALAVTGAGISKESGIPTFREAGSGLWSRFLPEEMASPQGWRENPRRVWTWYAWRRGQVERVQPNPAHYALAQLEAFYPEMLVATQNVDALHTRAGSSHVAELHGNITHARCTRDGDPVDVPLVAVPEPPEGAEPAELDVPTCPRCGALVRPDVVWFGEPLPMEVFERAEAFARTAEVCFVVGTSALVYPAAGLPETAKRHGALLVEINPDPTPLTWQADLSLRGPAGLLLPALAARITSA